MQRRSGPLVHRIVGGDAATGFITRGDANSYDDPWRPRPEDIAGKYEARVAGAGALIQAGHNPPILGGMWALVIFCLVFGYSGTRRVRRYAIAMGLDHWPLLPNERPRWEVQAVFRDAEAGNGRWTYQTWSRRDRAWIDVLATDDSRGSDNWFGGSFIEFGDPMVVDATETDVEALISSWPRVASRGDEHQDGPRCGSRGRAAVAAPPRRLIRDGAPTPSARRSRVRHNRAHGHAP